MAKKQMLLQGGTTKRALFVGLIIWLLLCVLHRYVGVVGSKMGILLGIVVLWGMTELLSSAIKRRLLSVAVYSFFVYVMHSFVIRTMKVLLAQNFPQNEAVALVAYFVLPIITFALLLLMGHYWKRLLPMVYSVCMGGRG